ncbi:WxL protein host-binding domain-containing protein [Candidatus Enterococcus ferrettii]|uniref:DUF3324 domain-containing protein n=1 Tax=Candidatus Enterococcus ferrettii TaxID=2815324 RepID=A0ABV0ESE6_9ENTE|nr:DUF916 and DUF3324 domain-containing protein [Enterococcus sp. 665A]
MKNEHYLKKTIRMVVTIILFSTLFSGITGYADEEKNSTANEPNSELADRTGFTVETIQPETQIDKTAHYFYIHVNPEESQTLKVKVISKRKEPSKVSVHLNNAVTNITGQIDYGQENAQLDSSMKLPLTDIVKIEQKEITVENFEEKIVELKVNPPKEKFSGVRLGAVVFRSAEESENESGVKSTYGYKISVMTSEDLAPYNKGGELNYLGVKATLYNGEKVVTMTAQNPNPFVLEKLMMTTKLRKKGQKEVIASNALQDMKIAPNSSFDFLTYLGIEELEPGKYVIESKATDGEKNWNWEKEFEITNKQANQINKDAAYKITMPRLYKIIGIILLVLTTGNIAYLIYRRKTQQGGGKDDAKEE